LEEIVEVEVVMEVTEVVASEVVEDSVVETVETAEAMEVAAVVEDLEEAIKWEEVTAETTEESGHTKCLDGHLSSL